MHWIGIIGSVVVFLVLFTSRKKQLETTFDWAIPQAVAIADAQEWVSPHRLKTRLNLTQSDAQAVLSKACSQGLLYQAVNGRFYRPKPQDLSPSPAGFHPPPLVNLSKPKPPSNLRQLIITVKDYAPIDGSSTNHHFNLDLRCKQCGGEVKEWPSAGEPVECATCHICFGSLEEVQERCRTAALAELTKQENTTQQDRKP